MKMQFYKLTAKHDCETDFEVFEKGDDVYTHHPENYRLEDFDCVEWDTSWKIEG